VSVFLLYFSFLCFCLCVSSCLPPVFVVGWVILLCSPIRHNNYICIIRYTIHYKIMVFCDLIVGLTSTWWGPPFIACPWVRITVRKVVQVHQDPVANNKLVLSEQTKNNVCSMVYKNRWKLGFCGLLQSRGFKNWLFFFVRTEVCCCITTVYWLVFGGFKNRPVSVFSIPGVQILILRFEDGSLVTIVSLGMTNH
jgi:hypothetical protein